MAVVAKTVLIDYNILGWANIREKEISKTHERIVRVGLDELPRRKYDEHLAQYCQDNDCDIPLRIQSHI